MSIRVALIAVLLAGPACAAPLCRDTKGLYTPCAPGQGEPRARAGRPGKPGVAAPAPAPGAAPSSGPAAAPVADGRRPLVAHIRKLCHDSKGLYTPCPR